MKNVIAESKLFKVGEPLTSNVDGNTEPSTLDSSNEACVETRRKVCVKCGNEVSQSKYSSAKYCSDKCRNAYNSYKYRVLKGLIDNPGVGSGGNQEKSIENSSAKIACKKVMKLLPNICNRCQSLTNLLAHHIDEDRANNKLENFEILCKGCHQKHHEHRDIDGKYTKV